MEDEFERQAIDNFCENVKSWLHSLDLTVEELSEQSGVAIRTIENILKNKVNSIPSTDILIKLSDVFEIPVDELLFGNSWIVLNSDFNSLSVQGDSNIQEDQTKVIEIIRQNILPVVNELKKALDLTADTINDSHPDKVWMNEISKIDNLVIDFSIVVSNLDLEEVDAEDENSIEDQFDNLFKAFDMTKELMINTFGFDINNNNIDTGLHQGAYLMAIYQLAKRCSEIIAKFLEVMVNLGIIAERQIKEYLPMIDFDEDL